MISSTSTYLSSMGMPWPGSCPGASSLAAHSAARRRRLPCGASLLPPCAGWRALPGCSGGSSAAPPPRRRLALLGGASGTPATPLSLPPRAGGFAAAPDRRGGARALPPALLSALVRARPREVFNHCHQTCAPGRVARRSGSPTAANVGARIGERRSGTPYRRSVGERCGVAPWGSG